MIPDPGIDNYLEKGILLEVCVRAAGIPSIPVNGDDASTNMTGITTSFANHKCCCDFRVEAESKGGLMIDDMKGRKW